MGALAAADRRRFEADGFVRLPAFADPDTCAAMLADVVAVTRAQAAGAPEPDALVLPEANLVGRDGAPEELASKVFRLHRRGVFEAFARSVHEHVPDRRPDANYGYVEIVDHDMADAIPVLMDPGDLLLFDSHLMHRSTDNESDGVRAAMVYHYCATGTVERTPGLVNDFVTVRP